MRDLLVRFKFHARKVRLNISKGDIVLDIGSGNRPHPRADVLCDLYEDGSNFHRQERSLVMDQRPLVQADICNLPFQTKVFDYVIASHVLEHVQDIERAIKELTRIARRGYIETPAIPAELLFTRPEHVWLVELETDTLVLIPKHVLDYMPRPVLEALDRWKALIERQPGD